MPAVTPGNSSKCALKSQQPFQITAMKTALAAALPQLGMKSCSWQLPNTDCHQNSSPRGHFMCGCLHQHTPALRLRLEGSKLQTLWSHKIQVTLSVVDELPAPTQVQSIREMPKITNQKGPKVKFEF